MTAQRNVVSIGDAKAGRINGKHQAAAIFTDPQADLSKRINDTLAMLSKTRDRFARLPESDRDALSLVVIDGLSYREAADRLKISLDALMERLAHAREMLRQLIANDRQN